MQELARTKQYQQVPDLILLSLVADHCLQFVNYNINMQLF